MDTRFVLEWNIVLIGGGPSLKEDWEKLPAPFLGGGTAWSVVRCNDHGYDICPEARLRVQSGEKPFRVSKELTIVRAGCLGLEAMESVFRQIKGGGNLSFFYKTQDPDPSMLTGSFMARHLRAQGFRVYLAGFSYDPFTISKLSLMKAPEPESKQ